MLGYGDSELGGKGDFERLPLLVLAAGSGLPDLSCEELSRGDNRLKSHVLLDVSEVQRSNVVVVFGAQPIAVAGDEPAGDLAGRDLKSRLPVVDGECV